MTGDQQRMLEANNKLTGEIHAALIGNPKYKIPGLVDDVANLKIKVEHHDRKLLKWGCYIIGAGGTIEAMKFLYGLSHHL